MMSRENVGTKSEMLEGGKSKDTTKHKQSPLTYFRASKFKAERKHVTRGNIEGKAHATQYPGVEP